MPVHNRCCMFPRDPAPVRVCGVRASRPRSVRRFFWHPPPAQRLLLRRRRAPPPTMLQIPSTMAFARAPTLRRGVQRCCMSTTTTPEEALAYRKFGKSVKEAWLAKNSRNNPLMASFEKRWWTMIPQPPEGCHVLDIAPLCRDETMLADINRVCQEIKAKTGVTVKIHLYGDIWSHSVSNLAKRVGAHEADPEMSGDKHQNYVLIVASRKAGQMHTYVAPGLWHVLHPLWLRQEFNSIFKVEGFTTRDWDEKILHYLADMRDQCEKNRGWIRTGDQFPLYPFLQSYFPVLLAGLAFVLFVIGEYLDYRAYWARRYCDACAQYMQVKNDPILMREAMTGQQRKEYQTGCVIFRFWECVSEACAAEKRSRYVEEMKWNSLRDDCLTCVKCGCRCSKGHRQIAQTPDSDNYGEAINIRECAFCGYKEAWTSIMPANYGGWNEPEHSRPLAGNYGSGMWITFKMSYIGKMIFAGEGAPAAELRKGNVGELAHKTHSYGRQPLLNKIFGGGSPE